jgi:hypothetical protein
MRSLPCRRDVSELINTQRGRYTQGPAPQHPLFELKRLSFFMYYTKCLGSTNSMIDLNLDASSDKILQP